jgi:hypothetical protein
MNLYKVTTCEVPDRPAQVFYVVAVSFGDVLVRMTVHPYSALVIKSIEKLPGTLVMPVTVPVPVGPTP